MSVIVLSPTATPAVRRGRFMRLCGIGCKDYICISNVLPEDGAFVPAAKSDCI